MKHRLAWLAFAALAALPLARPTAAAEPVVPQPAAATETPSYTFNQVAVSAADNEEEINDPFERRVRNALKFGPSRREGLQHAV